MICRVGHTRPKKKRPIMIPTVYGRLTLTQAIRAWRTIKRSSKAAD